LTLFIRTHTVVEAQIVYKLAERIDVEPVWTGHPVGCALLTEGDRQFLAYYDAERNMTVAQRQLNDTVWTFKRLPTKIGWDSHNYVTMALDAEKYLHVSGNMHGVPLIYFRSQTPLDVTSLERIPAMVGELEQRCTYPHFLTGPNGEFLFNYRDGGSGDGNTIWNIYDTKTKQWSRLFDKPMFDGEGLMNAYHHGPMVGPDGYYHLTWIWRDTPDCETNHSFSYSRSKNLRQWENSKGEPMALPFTLKTGEIIDAAKPGEGLFNPHQRIGFDLQNRVILSYTKYDQEGNNQVYNVRLENGEWKYHQATQWTYRWAFQGRGSVGGEISYSAVEIQDGRLVQTYSHRERERSGRWFLDDKTLKPVERAPQPTVFPPEVRNIELDFPNLQARSAWDIADTRKPHKKGDIRYMMRWESQGTNRDRPHPQTPPPTMLRVLKLVSEL
jgi:hypothetical protein